MKIPTPVSPPAVSKDEKPPQKPPASVTKKKTVEEQFLETKEQGNTCVKKV